MTIQDQALENFAAEFPKDASAPLQITDGSGWNEDPLIIEFNKYIGLGSFASGAIRFFAPGNMRCLMSWTRISGVPQGSELNLRLIPFASTWHGDLFCLDRSATPHSVVMLEPGTGKLLKIAGCLRDFMGALITNREAALVEDFFNQWKNQGGAVPGFSQCVGYRLPLFLNGEDTIDNLELIDQEVYIDICGQLYSQVVELPVGASISEFVIRKRSYDHEP